MTIHEQNNIKYITIDDDTQVVPFVDEGKLMLRFLKPDNSIHTEVRFSRFHLARDFIKELKEIDDA